MVKYEPIADLVEKLPAETWTVLEQINTRRRGMMILELLGQRPQPQRDNPRPVGRLSRHPDTPRMR